MTDQIAADAPLECLRCGKVMPLCTCDSIVPVDSRIAVLILQHPQEQDKALGTARLAAQHFASAVVKIGLSWPSLSKALGRPVPDPARWGVLYLGSVKATALGDGRSEIIAIDRKGQPVENQRGALKDIEGIVVLDGTWSQAKALWWRNPWMLKCQRIILGPHRPSRYGQLRREPRSDGLSTIEAIGLLCAGLERRPDIAATLDAAFARMLTRYREVSSQLPGLAAPSKRRRNFRYQKR